MLVRRAIVSPDRQHQRALAWLLGLATLLTCAGVTGVVLIVCGPPRGFGL